MGVFILCLAVIAAFLGFAFWTNRQARRKRIEELRGLVEPLGFELRIHFDSESAAYFDQHQWPKRHWFRVHTVCIADNDSIRIVVMEYRLEKGFALHYILGIRSTSAAPYVVLKRRTASTESMWTADWRDVMFQVRIEEDPEFDRKFIVVGDPDQVRAFLNPTRRKTLCEATDLPNVFSYSDNSVLLEFSGWIEAATFEQNVGQCLALTSLLLET